MKKQILLIVFVIEIIFAFACSEDSPSNPSTNFYKYTGYDSSWNKIIIGYLWVDTIDSLEVKGRWNFNLVGNGENIGPQTGKGEFHGTMNMLGSMSLNLNPGMVDNNVILDGSMRLPDRFDGTWSYYGFPGLINYGRFEAHKR
jgi:hypothetical protein